MLTHAISRTRATTAVMTRRGRWYCRRRLENPVSAGASTKGSRRYLIEERLRRVPPRSGIVAVRIAGWTRRNSAAADSMVWPGREPGDDTEEIRARVVDSRITAADERFGVQRRDDVERATHFRAEESAGHHTDDRERHHVQPDHAADHVGRTAKSALPEGVADDGDRSVRASAAAIVHIRERATEKQARHRACRRMSRSPTSLRGTAIHRRRQD